MAELALLERARHARGCALLERDELAMSITREREQITVDLPGLLVAEIPAQRGFDLGADHRSKE